MTVIATEVEKYPNNQNLIQNASKEKGAMAQENTWSGFTPPKPCIQQEEGNGTACLVSLNGGQ